MAKRTKSTETSPITPAPARRRTAGVKTAKKATPVVANVVEGREFLHEGDPVVQSPSYDDIATRAYDLYLRRGATDGCDMDDWLEAERQLRGSRQK